jgi:hypothetical protein
MSRPTFTDAALVLATVALLAWACTRIDDGMTKCQERHSFATCHAALNR